MKKQIQFSLEHTLGDTASSAFHGINGLNCFEYTLWQLLRQNGVRDYYAAIHTKAFLTETRPLNKLFSFRPILQNMEKLEKNMLEFYGIRRVSFKEFQGKKTLPEFVKETVDKDRFIYTLYNNYFDKVNKKAVRPKRHEIHCTLITGYDDDRKEYIPLVDRIYNLGYEDIIEMSEDFQKMPEWLFSWSLFYLSKPEPLCINHHDYKERLLYDLDCTVADWGREIEIFDQGIDMLKDSFSPGEAVLEESKAKKLWEISFVLHNVQIGLEGNLYLKLRALKAVTGMDLSQLYADFLASRSKTKTIANVFARLSLDYDYEKLLDNLSKLKSVFVDEAEVFRQQLYKKINFI